MKQATVHVISHSHWDREWYMTFEQHRKKLVKLIDDAMELFEKDETFKSFHLDSQTIVLEDYLEIRPQNREKLLRYIREGRFVVGPWYILQDEFLTSGEANVRNLLTGMKMAEEAGAVCRVGYFPDAFGNAGQMPQLLRQAGMEAAVFGRGVKPVGFDNQVLEGGDYTSAYSEMYWESPDHSRLPGILFANWYNNGAEIPVEEEAAKAYWDERLKRVKRFAGTNQLLFMNGCDHQPVQKDLGRALEVARRLYPEMEFVHSDFPAYVEAVCRRLGTDITTVRGELTSQETDGLYTLVNTTSARVDLKIENRKCETALEKEAEPLFALAGLFGMEDQSDFLRYSWKMLMKNHPHDSICNCSIDSVQEEMKDRFAKSLQVAQEVAGECRAFLAAQLSQAAARQSGEGDVAFVVWNTTGWEKSQVISILLDWQRIGDRPLHEAWQDAEKLAFPSFVVKDAEGNPVEALVEDAGTAFGYTLPDDRFRQPYMARQARVTFEAKAEGMGYAVYTLCRTTGAKTAKEERAASLVSAPNTMENAFLRVEIAQDGSFSLTDQMTGKCFCGLNYYEDCGDIGNEYIFVQPKHTEPITTQKKTATIRLAEDTPWRAAYEIEQELLIPESADALLEKERCSMVEFHARQAQRSEKMTVMKLVTRLSLEKGGRGVKVETSFDNTAKDHRLRAVFPTALRTGEHYADSLFEVVKRPNRHKETWKNPSGCEHQQNFVAMCDETGGLLVANFGLYEYEILPDAQNAIALTLLRCVGEMGDWGVFPTPDAQMQGPCRLRYEVVPFAADRIAEAYREGYQFQCDLAASRIPVQSMQKPSPEAKKLPLSAGFLNWQGSGLNLTGFKRKEDGEDIIVRFVNVTDQPVLLQMQKSFWMQEAYRSDILEREKEPLTENASGLYEVRIAPFEIATFGLRQQGKAASISLL